MVEQRASIISASLALAELVNEGGTITSIHRKAAERVIGLCRGKGVYRKKYDTHEERVLHRHLNMYKNKLAKATSAADRNHWKAKIVDQEALIAAASNLMNLDDL
jgi:hypothetical protein